MSKKSQELIYGIHAVEAAIRNQPENVLQVFVQQGRNDNRIKKIIELAKNSGVSLQSISNDKLKEKCSKVEHHARHQGVVAELRANKSSAVSLDTLLEKESLLLLVLDEVQDPHNIGACLRTADAVGVDAVIVSKNRSPALTPVMRNVASGAAETVPYIMVSNLARALEKIKQSHVWVMGTSGDAKNSIHNASDSSNMGKRVALVMGSEGKGMRRLTRDACDELVCIPMQGSVESLNISVATAVCLYEIRRQQKDTV
ncbi:23S rRNA (guanosine(2251)-2'-O)-methyltransferase RlmB [Cardiobacterium sp. AH-315-I02]|nr:23S rRNA (guanosine(2251)-2'-O)-methyltransferase RlmB [Cardiobacterium sp. AH-315-I02]